MMLGGVSLGTAGSLDLRTKRDHRVDKASEVEPESMTSRLERRAHLGRFHEQLVHGPNRAQVLRHHLVDASISLCYVPLHSTDETEISHLRDTSAS